MKHDLIHILSTKILDDANIKSAASENIIIDCIPFIAIRAIDAGLQQKISEALIKYRYIIFTSANAVEAVAQQLSDKPRLHIFCISGKTRKAVEENFPDSAIVDDAPNGAELAEKIIVYKINSAVFFCGDKRLNTIPDKLRDHNIQLQEIIVYETVLTPEKINKDYNSILFFSPSAVESFFSVNDPAVCKAAFSFAASTYQALLPIMNKIIISKTASEQGMLNTVIDYYKPIF